MDGKRGKFNKILSAFNTTKISWCYLLVAISDLFSENENGMENPFLDVLILELPMVILY
jgi:hypothetical protein